MSLFVNDVGSISFKQVFTSLVQQEWCHGSLMLINLMFILILAITCEMWDLNSLEGFFN